jgi:hypothetical protein
MVSVLILGLVLILAMASGSQTGAARAGTLGQGTEPQTGINPPHPFDLEPIPNPSSAKAAISATVWFRDVAVELNAAAPGYGSGVAWGDYEGGLSLYVANQGACRPNRLLRNDVWIYWPLVRRDS